MFLVFMDEVASGIFLAIGVLKIRGQIKQRSSTDQVNTTQLVLHFLVFGFYLLGSLLMGGYIVIE